MLKSNKLCSQSSLVLVYYSINERKLRRYTIPNPINQIECNLVNQQFNKYKTL